MACLISMGSGVVHAQETQPSELRKAVTLYASFDEHVHADFGRGQTQPSRRFDSETEPGKFEFVPGFDSDKLRIAAGRGIRGGALEAVDVLPRRGRHFFPAKDNLAFRPQGWSGSISMWIATDPNQLLKTPFCDPIQITEKGANNGGLWCDFPDSKPRDFRLGAFSGLREGEPAIAETDPQAPLIVVRKIGFKVGDWHHVAMTWSNFDSGQPNAQATLYIDGKPLGQLADREIAMRWNLDRTGIYFAVNYLGLLDELALFNRALSADEVKYLYEHPQFELWVPNR